MDIKGLLTEAVKKNASDIIFSVGSPPKLRIADTLVDFGNDRLTPELAAKMVLSLLNDNQKKQFERNRCIDFSTYLKGIGRFRVTAYFQRGFVGAVFRVVMPQIPSPEELHIPKNITDMCFLKQGLILVTGPSGSGKSTTIASLIDHINKHRGAHIITIEDPIEFSFKPERSVIDQIEIGKDIQETVPALKNVLHQNPEIVVLSEINDMETILAVLKIASSGHLVLSTMPTQNVISTLNSLIEIFPDYQQQQVRVNLSTILKAIVSQQLFACDNQYGRIAAREILVVNEIISNLIIENKIYMIPNAINSDKTGSMCSMEASIKDLFAKGLLSSDVASSTGGANEIEREMNSDIRTLEKNLYDKNTAVRRQAETELRKLEREGNKTAAQILSEFAAIYETNFEENKISGRL